MPWYIITPEKLRQVVLILVGAAIAAVGLQGFLIPNHLLDGGVVGVSIITSALTHIQFGALLIVFNLPFIWLGYRKLGKKFAVLALLGIITLALATTVFRLNEGATTEPLLAAVFGGVLVGLGIGIVVRAGGTLDGTEIVAILADRKLPFSIGEIILFLNIFILGSAGFVFGWDNAMYSLIAYFVAYKTIDVTVAGLDESRSAWIVSDAYEAIAQSIKRELGYEVTFMAGHSTDRREQSHIIFTVITRIEEQRLKTLVHRHDRKAFIAFGHVHEVIGRSEPASGSKLQRGLITD